MTPRQRVEIALHGGVADRVPFTIYESIVPQCAAEREMRNRGLCIVERRVPVVKRHHPNVKTTSTTAVDDRGRKLVRTVHETPAGTLSTLAEPAGFTNWLHERMFKGPDDYKPMLAYIRDEQYEPCYDSFVRAEADLGGDAICRTSFGLEPLQTLISGMMGTEAFCLEWMDRRDEVMKLYDAVVEKRREIYPLIAASPCGHANYGGNVVPEIIGLETFETLYVPHYNEAAEAMHAHGKLIGCHFDANCRLLAKAIAATDLDYIEAFTPAPDTDMTLADARAAWPDKVLWLNFPSSVHLRPDQAVEAVTADLLTQASRPDGLIMGITENIPKDRWQNSCLAIINALDRHANQHPDLYA